VQVRPLPSVNIALISVYHKKMDPTAAGLKKSPVQPQNTELMWCNYTTLSLCGVTIQHWAYVA